MQKRHQNVKKSSKRLSKDRAKDLAASDESSYFEQEQLLSLTTKEKDESQDDDEMVSASRAKILQRTTEESQGTERQESWQKWLAEQLCPGMVCKKTLQNQLLVVFVIQMWLCSRMFLQDQDLDRRVSWAAKTPEATFDTACKL